MKKNVGNADKIIRVILAILGTVLYFTGAVTGIIGIILLVVAVVLVITVFLSFCPIYFPFGLSTRKKEDRS